jgi:hypothetical protein
MNERSSELGVTYEKNEKIQKYFQEKNYVYSTIDCICYLLLFLHR